MKTQTTRIPPNYPIIITIVISTTFWLGLIKVLFGHEIKVWVLSTISSVL